MFDNKAKDALNQKHSVNPQVGDYWSEMFLVVALVIEVTDDYVIYAKSLLVDNDNKVDAADDFTISTRKEFTDWITYTTNDNTWADVAPEWCTTAVKYSIEYLEQNPIKVTKRMDETKIIENGPLQGLRVNDIVWVVDEGWCSIDAFLVSLSKEGTFVKILVDTGTEILSFFEDGSFEVEGPIRLTMVPSTTSIANILSFGENTEAVDTKKVTTPLISRRSVAGVTVAAEQTKLRLLEDQFMALGDHEDGKCECMFCREDD